jgi:hypothetical protein
MKLNIHSCEIFESKDVRKLYQAGKQSPYSMNIMFSSLHTYVHLYR